MKMLRSKLEVRMPTGWGDQPDEPDDFDHDLIVYESIEVRDRRHAARVVRDKSLQGEGYLYTIVLYDAGDGGPPVWGDDGWSELILAEEDEK